MTWRYRRVNIFLKAGRRNQDTNTFSNSLQLTSRMKGAPREITKTLTQKPTYLWPEEKGEFITTTETRKWGRKSQGKRAREREHHVVDIISAQDPRCSVNLCRKQISGEAGKLKELKNHLNCYWKKRVLSLNTSE